MSEIKNRFGIQTLPHNLSNLSQESKEARAADRGNRSLSSLANSKKAATDSRNPKELEAAKMFENHFIRQIIGEMRKTVPDDPLVPNSMGEQIFRDKLDDEYADNWVNNGGIGLTEVIYDQLERMQSPAVGPAKANSKELLAIKPGGGVEGAGAGAARSSVAPRGGLRDRSDLFSNADKSLFLLKKTEHGFQIKSREPLNAEVNLQAPINGRVVQAAALPEGRQMIIIQPANMSEGMSDAMLLQFVHSGKNLIKPGDQIAAGQTIAQLAPAKQAEQATVFMSIKRAQLE